MFYQDSCLTNAWKGLENHSERGIRILQNVTFDDAVLAKHVPEPLDVAIVSGFLRLPSVTNYLSQSATDFYLQLTINSTSYLTTTPKLSHFEKGPYNDQNAILTRVAPQTSSTSQVQVSISQQEVLQHIVEATDIWSCVLINSACGSLPFTIGMIQSVAVTTFTACIYLPESQSFEAAFTLSSMTKTFSKDNVIKKGIEFKTNGVLKKKFINTIKSMLS